MDISDRNKHHEVNEKNKSEGMVLFSEKIRFTWCVNADLFPVLVPVARGATSLAPVIQHIAIATAFVHIKYLDFANPAVIRWITQIAWDRDLILCSVTWSDDHARKKHPKEY
jgi:hypothetical protein